MNVVYVNGDSFTEGCEIANHLCYGAFERYYSFNDIRKKFGDRTQEIQQLSIKKIQDWYTKNPDKLDEIFEYESQKRWSRQLEKLIGRPVLNLSSQGGSSMYAIAYRSILDIVELLRQGVNITDIIIQVTSPYRTSFFKNTSKTEEPRIAAGQQVINQYRIISKSYQSLVEANLYEDAEWLQYRYIHDLFMLSKTIKTLTNARLIFVDSLFYRKSLLGSTGINLPNTERNHVTEFKETLDNEIELGMMDLVELDEPDTMTSGLHFTEKIHARFASAIAERYFK